MNGHYSFHDVGISVSSDSPEVFEAIDSRLKLFSVCIGGEADAFFEYGCVPDGASHAVERPQIESRPVYLHPDVEVAYHDGEDLLYMEHGDCVKLLCAPSRGVVQVSVVQAGLPDLRPLTHLMFTIPLIELLKRRGLYSLHAAGLCAGRGGIFFPGTSGAGKSTLTLALLRAGFDYLGDDMVFITSSAEGLRISAFPDEIDVTDHTAKMFPELSHLAGSTKSFKSAVRAEDFYPGDIIWQCVPQVLVFPRVANTRTSVLKAMNRDDALLELVPNVLLTDPQSSQAHLDALAQLVDQTECFQLETGTDFVSLAKLIRSLVT